MTYNLSVGKCISVNLLENFTKGGEEAELRKLCHVYMGSGGMPPPPPPPPEKSGGTFEISKGGQEVFKGVPLPLKQTLYHRFYIFYYYFFLPQLVLARPFTTCW